MVYLACFIRCCTHGLAVGLVYVNVISKSDIELYGDDYVFPMAICSFLKQLTLGIVMQCLGCLPRLRNMGISCTLSCHELSIFRCQSQSYKSASKRFCSTSVTSLLVRSL